jgi:Icc protein
MKYWSAAVMVVCVTLLCTGYLYRREPAYPVYEGETLFKKNVYPFEFAFFGDSSPEKGSEQPESFKKMIEMINEDNPLFVVGGGDFVVEATPENFEAFQETISALHPPLFCVCGNHDDSEYYEDYLGERVYAFTYQHCLFVVLDNSRKLLGKNQLEFLENQLKKDYEHTFVICHIPPFDPEGPDCMMNPEDFMELILTYQVDYVLCSHIHCFYEEKVENTTFIISGGAGLPLHREGFNHYILMHVGDDITYEVVRV